jgi:periplasmic protein CpxP/Spy
MNTLYKSILIGLTVLGMGATTLSAQAEEARAGQRENHAKWGERAAEHQQKLREQLKLTPSQEAAWSTYTAAIKPAAPGERGEHGKRAHWKALPAPERMEKRIDMAKRHVAMMETRLAALNTFYAVLTPEQKKVFDANSMRHGARHMRHHSMG